MGKARQKNHKHDEFLLQQVRHYKKEIKRKDQEIRKLQKELGYGQNKMNSIKEEVEDIKSNPCDACGKGELREIIVVGRQIFTCDTCHFRSKARKL